MSLFILFCNGKYSLFHECEAIVHSTGIVRIYENDECYEYEEDEIKEIIFVNNYTSSSAIELIYDS